LSIDTFKNCYSKNRIMTSAKEGYQTPQSSAGILGISSNTNLGGWKFDPRGVVIFTIVFIAVIKILHYTLKI